MNKKIEVALLGGAFNPITKGHLQIAEFVLQQLPRISEVWFMPCYDHVYHKEMVPGTHRLNMCRIAAAANPRTKVFDYEITHKASEGTYLLLKDLLKEEFSQAFHYSIIIGQDNANTFDNWLYHEELKQLVPFIVVPRKGIAPPGGNKWYEKQPHIYLNNNSTIMEVSSTKVRTLLKEGHTDQAESLLVPEVWQYIQDKGLYQ